MKLAWLLRNLLFAAASAIRSNWYGTRLSNFHNNASSLTFSLLKKRVIPKKGNVQSQTHSITPIYSSLIHHNQRGREWEGPLSSTWWPSNNDDVITRVSWQKIQFQSQGRRIKTLKRKWSWRRRQLPQRRRRELTLEVVTRKSTTITRFKHHRTKFSPKLCLSLFLTST